MQSVLDHIAQSRLGYARQIVDDAIRHCKPGVNPECEQVQRIRGRIATYLLVAIQSGGLDEPELPQEAGPVMPAAAPPPLAPAGGEPEQSAAPEGAEEPVILEKNPPPRMPRRKP